MYKSRKVFKKNAERHLRGSSELSDAVGGRPRASPLRHDPLRLRMDQRIGERAQRLAKEFADLRRRPPRLCSPDRQGRRRGAIVPPEYGALHKDSALGSGQLVKPGAQLWAACSVDQFGHLAGREPGSGKILVLDAVRGSAGGSRRGKGIGIRLIHPGYGRFDQVMTRRIDGCVFLRAGIHFHIGHCGFNQVERFALIAQHQGGKLIKLSRCVLSPQKAAFTIAILYQLNLRFASIFNLTGARSGVKSVVPGCGAFMAFRFGTRGIRRENYLDDDIYH
jgi:hypothetical protein